MSSSSNSLAVQKSPGVPRVAVALAAFNGMKYIGEQVESILNQTGVNVCIFVSVDKSSDGTARWIAELASKDARVTLLPYGSIFGEASANFFRLIRDICLDEFDYLAYADQDDIWVADKLQRALREMHLHGADGYSSSVTAFWSSGKTRVITKSQPQRPWDHLCEAAGPGCTYVMNQRLSRELQMVARTRAEVLSKLTFHDWFSYAYARSHGYSWHIDDYSGLMYRQHDANQFGANAGWRPLVRRIRQVWSGEAFVQLRMMADAVDLPANHPVRDMLSHGACGLVRLAFRARSCRRKNSERVAFFVSCLVGAIRSMHCKPTQLG